MPTVPNTYDADLANRREIALNYLSLTRRDMEEVTADLEQVKTARLRHINNARAYGLSNQAIADALGLTEGAVRQILKPTGDGQALSSPRAASTVLAFLINNPKASNREIAKSVGLGRTTVNRAIRRLVVDRRISVQAHGTGDDFPSEYKVL